MFRYKSKKSGEKFPQIRGTEPSDIAARLNTIYARLNAPSPEQVSIIWRQPGSISPAVTELEIQEQRKRDSKLRAQHAIIERVLECYEEDQEQKRRETDEKKDTIDQEKEWSMEDEDVENEESALNWEKLSQLPLPYGIDDDL